MIKIIIGNATLYCGDSKDVLDIIPNVQTVVTDPPYGIGLEYGEDFTDTEEYINTVVQDIIKKCRDKADVVSVTTGNINHYSYPRPTWTLCWFNKAGSGSGPWGFSCWQPILCYGKDPYLSNRLGRRPDFIEHSETSEKNGHPCPKPIHFTEKWINRVHLKGTVLDPFMGSGTTGVACVNLGFPFIGIELDERYFDIACERIEIANSQPKLFEQEEISTFSQNQLFM